MKTTYQPKRRLVSEYVPEWLQDHIDWTFDFHDGEWADGRGGRNPECTPHCIELLRKCEAGVGVLAATDDGGWPRFGWGIVVAVGMAAKWPYWSPRPTVAVRKHNGDIEWIDWASLKDVRALDAHELALGLPKLW